ncbi:transposase [Streptomyces sp. NPDC058293]|uniref:transposase n=1 Tax=Streptomyces sp. NPDC058293 TaxID=3346429 RepID=UPI0036E684C7
MLSHDPREDIIRSTSPDDSELPTKGWLGGLYSEWWDSVDCFYWRPAVSRRSTQWGRKYSPGFRADAVALYHSSPGGTYASVAKDLGVNHETLRTWVRNAEQGARPGAVEATAMEKEYRQLWARVKELELEREILRRAAKYFAAETSW